MLGSIANFVCSLFPQPIPGGFSRAARSPSSSQTICMRNASSIMMYDIISFENHRLTCFAWLDLIHVMHCKFTREKNDWHMLCKRVASNIIHSSIGQLSSTSPVEFFTDEFRAEQVWRVLWNGKNNKEKRNKVF